MYIHLDADGALRLEEPDDFKRFHVEVADPTLDAHAVVAALAPSAEPADGDDLWIAADRVRALSGRAGDAGWAEQFDAMLAAVRRFGWVSPDGARIRAHVKRPAAG